MNVETVKFSSNDTFSDYCQSVGELFCPYLLKAETEDVLFKTKIDLTAATSIKEAQEIFFYNSLFCTENFRQFRLQNPNVKGIFYCINLYFESPPILGNKEANKILDWVHWTLKCMYSKVGIMFGKFWVNEKLIGRNGLEVASPPLNFLSIRSAIKPKDPYFLTNTEFILQDMLSSNDTGEDLHSEFGIPNLEKQSIADLKTANYYQLLKNWAKEQIPNE